MRRAGTRAASFAMLIGLVSPVSAEPPALVSCDDPPAAVLALGAKSDIDAFGIAPDALVAIAAMAGPGDGEGSLFRFAKAGGPPRDVKLAGRVLGLAVAPDGSFAYAIVRVTNRKGKVRSVELVRVDLEAAKVSSGPTIPATARGLALASGGQTLLIASRDEIRTLKLPGLASGPLYRVLGDNVGVAPIAGTSLLVIAQSSRVVLADLAGPQDRDGLVLSPEVPAPAPLRGMLAATGDAGPVVVADGGHAWCVRVTALPPPPPTAIPKLPVEPAPAPVVYAQPEEPPPEAAPVEEAPVRPGTVFGVVTGPAKAEVAAIVFLGPDNVLREAVRAIPDGQGRFATPTLPPGAYRLVAAGKRGRVLICDPSFVTIRVDSNGAVEAPVLKVVSAQ